MGSSRNIRRRVNCILIISLLSLLHSTNQIPIQARAQIYYPSYLGISSLVTYPLQEQENLSLIDSNIILSTELNNIRNDTMFCSFNCSYTISNLGTTANASFVIPISGDLYYYTSTDILARVNGTYVVVDTLERSEYRDELDVAFSYYPYYEYLLLNNTELQGSSNTIIEAFFGFTINIFADRTQRIISIFYDVGSINLWTDYLSKRVEYIATGVQPFSYSNYSDTTPDRKCEVTTYGEKTSYLWNWENEEIIENTIFAEWLVPRGKPFTFLVSWDSYGILMILISSFLLMFVNRIKKKKEDCLYE